MERRSWILFAENDPQDGKEVVRLLQRAQVRHQIILCSTGAEALSCLRAEGKFSARPAGDPAFVLLKLRLPVYDGVNVLRTIKEDLKMMHVPVVIYAGTISQERLEAAYVWGVNSYVLKPRKRGDMARVFTNLGQYWGMTNVHPGSKSAQSISGG